MTHRGGAKRMGTKSLRLVPLTWRSIYNHRREFIHPTPTGLVSPCPACPSLRHPWGLALGPTRDCLAGDVVGGPSPPARERGLPTLGSPVLQPTRPVRTGNRARALRSAPSQLCKGTRARVTYPSSGHRVERAMG